MKVSVIFSLSLVSLFVAAEAAPVITELDPPKIASGDWKELTIKGTGFGATTGQVWWTDEDTTPLAWSLFSSGWTGYLQSWTDTEIRIIVPSNAGTGKIKVVTAGLEEVFSPQPLKILYNFLNTTSWFVPLGPTYSRHLNVNGTGGYTFYFAKALLLGLGRVHKSGNISHFNCSYLHDKKHHNVDAIIL